MNETSVIVNVRQFGFLQVLMKEEILFGRQKLTDRSGYGSSAVFNEDALNADVAGRLYDIAVDSFLMVSQTAVFYLLPPQSPQRSVLVHTST